MRHKLEWHTPGLNLYLCLTFRIPGLDAILELVGLTNNAVARRLYGEVAEQATRHNKEAECRNLHQQQLLTLFKKTQSDDSIAEITCCQKQQCRHSQFWKV